MQIDADQKDSEQRQYGRGAGEHGHHRPPRQHRHLRCQQLIGDVAQARDFGLDPGKALHQRHIAERVGSTLGETGIVPLDRTLQGFGLVDHERGEERENHAYRDQHRAEHPIEVKRQRQQDGERGGRGERFPEKVEPQVPQCIGTGQHDLQQPARMGGVVKAQRQLQRVFEKAGEHGCAAAMGQPVGVERHRHAAHDGKQPEPDPGRDEYEQIRLRRRGDAGLGTGERVDDSPEQHRFGKLCAGQSQIGDRQKNAEARLWTKQGQHPRIEGPQTHPDLSILYVWAASDRRAFPGSSHVATASTSPRLRGEVGMSASFALIPGEGASPRVRALWKGTLTLRDSALVETPPHPDPLPASGEREQRRRAKGAIRSPGHRSLRALP